MNRFTLGSAAIAAALSAAPALAGPGDFHPGPVLTEFGPVATVDSDVAIPAGHVFRVSYDTSKQSDDGALNRTLTGAARFLNMHVASGVPEGDIHLAIVVHGSAVRDVATETAGANTDLVAALLEHGARIYVCGQSAVWYDIGNDALLPGVNMALSAMTAHALLQADGYTLNPF